MKRIISPILAFLAVFTLSYCGGNNTKEGNNNAADNNPDDTLTSYDSATVVTDAADTSSNYLSTFVVKAGSGGMMEVELGKLAQQNAQSQRVKNFGSMMVRDHSKANKELMTIAANKNIAIPSKLSQDHQKHVDEMKKLKGMDFDKHYMDLMKDDHEDDIELFEKAAKNLKDPDLKAFASKTLPILHTHLDSAKAIKDAID